MTLDFQGEKFKVKTEASELMVEPQMANIFCYKDTENHGQMFAGYQHQDQNGKYSSVAELLLLYCHNTEIL